MCASGLTPFPVHALRACRPSRMWQRMWCDPGGQICSGCMRALASCGGLQPLSPKPGKGYLGTQFAKGGFSLLGRQGPKWGEGHIPSKLLSRGKDTQGVKDHINSDRRHVGA